MNHAKRMMDWGERDSIGFEQQRENVTNSLRATRHDQGVTIAFASLLDLGAGCTQCTEGALVLSHADAKALGRHVSGDWRAAARAAGWLSPAQLGTVAAGWDGIPFGKDPAGDVGQALRNQFAQEFAK